MGKTIFKKRIQFNVTVDADLVERANKVRTQTWVQIVESAFHDVIAKAHATKGNKK